MRRAPPLPLIVSLLAAAWAAPAAAATPANGDFEGGMAAGLPTGWRLNGPPGQGYAVELVPEGAGHAVRIAGPAAMAGARQAFAAVAQAVDAAPYRGQRVTLRARVRTDRPTGPVGLVLRVDRPDRGRGFFDNMTDRPIRDPAWNTYEVTGFVAPDAVGIYLGLMVGGDGDARFDDVTLTLAPPGPPPTPEAQVYLDRAIGLLRAQHYRSGLVDWAKLTAVAQTMAEGARTPRDTYPAIRAVIDGLGERHTSLRAPGQINNAGPGGAVVPASVEDRGRIAVLRLPGMANDPADRVTASARYADAATAEVARRLQAGACGWVIDLRDETGGNMWPPMRVVWPLLGEPPFGWFVRADGQRGEWSAQGASSGMAPATRSTVGPRALPIAVLIGPRTGSAGEMVAVAFRGLPNARFFGQPSAGLTTGNRAVVLSDGASLVISGSTIQDRLGRAVEGPLRPDVTTTLEAAEAEAIAWLEAKACPSAHVIR